MVRHFAALLTVLLASATLAAARADLPSCVRARCAHCAVEFIARMCPAACGSCQNQEPSGNQQQYNGNYESASQKLAPAQEKVPAAAGDLEIAPAGARPPPPPSSPAHSSHHHHHRRQILPAQQQQATHQGRNQRGAEHLPPQPPPAFQNAQAGGIQQLNTQAQQVQPQQQTIYTGQQQQQQQQYAQQPSQPQQQQQQQQYQQQQAGAYQQQAQQQQAVQQPTAASAWGQQQAFQQPAAFPGFQMPGLQAPFNLFGQPQQQQQLFNPFQPFGAAQQTQPAAANTFGAQNQQQQQQQQTPVANNYATQGQQQHASNTFGQQQQQQTAAFGMMPNAFGFGLPGLTGAAQTPFLNPFTHFLGQAASYSTGANGQQQQVQQNPLFPVSSTAAPTTAPPLQPLAPAPQTFFDSRQQQQQPQQQVQQVQTQQYQQPQQQQLLPLPPVQPLPQPQYAQAQVQPQQQVQQQQQAQQDVQQVQPLPQASPSIDATPLTYNKDGKQEALQCPRQPNWQPCIDKGLANERFRNCCGRLGDGCLALCDYDATLTNMQLAVLTGRCPLGKVADVMKCASGFEDATPCCEAYGVFEPGYEHCRPYCNPAGGLPEGGLLSEKYKCLVKLTSIQQCFYVTQRP